MLSWLHGQVRGPQIGPFDQDSDIDGGGGDLSSITYPTGTPNVSFQYDGTRNRTQMIDGTGTTSYSYDAANRLISATLPGPRRYTGGQATCGSLSAPARCRGEFGW